MSNLNTKSPAKVNLHLKILKKLHNGYHELDTSFQLIDLYDELDDELYEDLSGTISSFESYFNDLFDGVRFLGEDLKKTILLI